MSQKNDNIIFSAQTEELYKNSSSERHNSPIEEDLFLLKYSEKKFFEIEPHDENCFSEYDSCYLTEYAIKNNLIKKNSEVKDFKVGHFKGYDAIKCYIKCKFNKQVQGVSKNLKTTVIPTIFDNMKNGPCEGMLIADIISQEKKNLGESLTIRDAIFNSGENFFSFDKKYTLPYYSDTDIELSNDEKDILSRLWKENKYELRKRKDFFHLFAEKICGFDKEKYDAGIKYLVINHIKGC